MAEKFSNAVLEYFKSISDCSELAHKVDITIDEVNVESTKVGKWNTEAVMNQIYSFHFDEDKIQDPYIKCHLCQHYGYWL